MRSGQPYYDTRDYQMQRARMEQQRSDPRMQRRGHDPRYGPYPYQQNPYSNPYDNPYYNQVLDGAATRDRATSAMQQCVVTVRLKAQIVSSVRAAQHRFSFPQQVPTPAHMQALSVKLPYEPAPFQMLFCPQRRPYATSRGGHSIHHILPLSQCCGQRF